MLLEQASIPSEVMQKRSYVVLKRTLDLSLTLIILLPLCLLTTILAILIRLDSPGPIFYRQRRIGYNGKEFWMLKFRSMYVNNDDRIHREAIQKFMSGQTINEQGSKLQFKIENDPRITRIGRFIRKTSVDELPQFFNVLRGEMSLVGPRPPLPYEVEKYSARDWLRLTGRPGLTGTWQVYGRGRVGFREMIDMDIAYLRKQSCLEDLKLIVLTVPVMLFSTGGA